MYKTKRVLACWLWRLRFSSQAEPISRLRSSFYTLCKWTRHHELDRGKPARGRWGVVQTLRITPGIGERSPNFCRSWKANRRPIFSISMLSLSLPRMPRLFKPSRGIFFTSNHRGSTKAYLYCWAGMRSGTVQAYSEYNVIGSPRSDSRYHRTINVANDVGQPFSRHTGGVNVVFADGSLRFISSDTSALIIFAMVSRAGGEKL